MRLEYIRSFIGVVNYKSFSIAAKYLFLSQPTISTHIKQLEAELGVQLLVRSTKDVILTEDGRVFYPYALRLLETETEALHHLSKNEVETVVNIAVSSVPGYYLFPQFLASFQCKNPKVNFRVSEGDSGEVLQKIIHFDVEIGIGSLKSANEKIHCEPILEDEIILITPNKEKYRALNGKFPVEMLKKESFITRETGSGTKIVSENIENDLNLNVHSMKIAAQFESSELVKRAVEAGAGIAFISKIAAKESIDRQKVLAFSFENVCAKRQIYLLYHKERMLGETTKNVIKSLCKFCNEEK